MIITFLILTFGIVYLLLYMKKYSEYIKNKQTYTFDGQKNKYLLTKNELSFFYKLKSITDKYNLYIFPKVRMADIINTKNFNDFNKIKSKHIDFTICNKYCSPILFIELDDNSHHNYIHKENDIKKDYIMENAKANLIRIKPAEIEYKLKYIESILINKHEIKTGSNSSSSNYDNIKSSQN